MEAFAPLVDDRAHPQRRYTKHIQRRRQMLYCDFARPATQASIAAYRRCRPSKRISVYKAGSVYANDGDKPSWDKPCLSGRKEAARCKRPYTGCQSWWRVQYGLPLPAPVIDRQNRDKRFHNSHRSRENLGLHWISYFQRFCRPWCRLLAIKDGVRLCRFHRLNERFYVLNRRRSLLKSSSIFGRFLLKHFRLPGERRQSTFEPGICHHRHRLLPRAPQ